MNVKTTESALVKACLEYLAMRGIFAFRVNTTGVKRTKAGREFWTFQGMKGVSDILGVLESGQGPQIVCRAWPIEWGSQPGRFLAVECKVGKTKPTPEQQLFLDTVARLGGVAIVARSVDDLIAGLGEP